LIAGCAVSIFFAGSLDFEAFLYGTPVSFSAEVDPCLTFRLGGGTFRLSIYEAFGLAAIFMGRSIEVTVCEVDFATRF
jgi:hypothetical protein